MTWKYIPILNVCFKILVTVCFGAIIGKTSPRKFDVVFVENSVQFVFHVALPCLVIKGLGVGIDFYSDTFVWKFIAAFLLLRAFALIFAIATNRFQRIHAGDGSGVDLSNVAVDWLSFTWISTVILGIPILSAVMGSPKKGLLYGILAAVSSFMFQLPFQLFLLEYHKAEQNRRRSEISFNHDNQTEAIANTEKGVGLEDDCDPSIHSINRRGYLILWKSILLQMCTNPVIWGIFCGFVISLSTFGKRFLSPTSDFGTKSNDNYVKGLQFLIETLTWFGGTVSPLSLFSMGIWMQSQGRNILSAGLYRLTMFMIAKLVLIPLVMVGIAKALHLNDESGRAAVLIAALPISMA
eukprot:329282_1